MEIDDRRQKNREETGKKSIRREEKHQKGRKIGENKKEVSKNDLVRKR